MSIIYIFIGIIIGWFIGTKGILKSTKNPFSEMNSREQQEAQSKAQEAFDERTEERLEKILEFITKETEHQKALANCSIEDLKRGATRQDIEELLDISTTTAHKYLDILEKENKIKQLNAGTNTSYILTS